MNISSDANNNSNETSQQRGECVVNDGFEYMEVEIESAIPIPVISPVRSPVSTLVPDRCHKKCVNSKMVCVVFNVV